MSNTFEFEKIELTQSQINAIELARNKDKEMYVLNTANNPNEEWRVNNPYSSLEGIPVKTLAIALFVPDSYRLKRSPVELLSDFYKQAQKDASSEDDEKSVRSQGKLEAISYIVSIIDTPEIKKFKENISDLPF
ncbi:hypothetical protein [Planococcus lenghuensis]|uniref:Uncharacterized protein n=1 Tax=Planococcus lenghuensis TaxID=2213202 RepID=A0A1Q2L5M6_9BACL|nr:hypothetical protein [Planococcus lenghuensis]AQQ55397.1 hypothetical protein B0X71_19710 [Planococcus lenghuensis]